MLDLLISECSDYELKKDIEVEKPRSWLKTISGFANTLGGTLIFGVEDNKRINGIEEISKSIEIITEKIKTRIKPLPEVEIYPFSEENKNLIAVKVTKGKSGPYYYSYEKTKEAYIRLGDETILAPSHILNELVLKGMNRTYDSIISIHKKRDFSFSYFEATYFERTHTKFKELDYISMKLMEKDGVLTNTGLLLSDQNIIYQSRVFCTHWDGKTKTSLNSEAIDDKEISGSIVHQLVASLEFIKNNMKKKWHKSGVYRVDKPDYDLDAIREAIVNALIHRDYSRVGCEVTIDLYQDRLEITSPGGMISGEKLELNTHSSIPSERRNPFLADIFSRMGFMERRGSGLNKIIDKTNALFKDEKVHVEYFSTNNFFRVIIKNANYKIDAVNDADDAVNDAIDAVNDTIDAVNDAIDAVKIEDFDVVNVPNEVNDAVKIDAQSSVDAVESEVVQFDAVKIEDFDVVNVPNEVNDAVNDADDAVNDAVDAVNDADDAVNDAVDAVNDADDAVNDADDAVNDADDAVNDADDAVNDADDAVNDADDAVNDEVINIIKKYPGLRAPSIYNLIKQKNPNITINIIRNRIRRELKNQIIFKGNSRTGGYYIK